MKFAFKDSNGKYVIEPELNDFGLTQEEIDKVKVSDEKYQNECYRVEIEKKEYEKKQFIWAHVVPFFVLFVCAGIAASNSIGWLSIVLFVLAIILPYVLGKLSDKDFPKPNRDDFIDSKMEIKINKYKEAVRIYRNQKLEYDLWVTRQKQDFWLNLDGLEFEKEVGRLYKKHGYKVTVTKATGDGGVDIILKKNGKTIAVQCKNHAKPIGPNDALAFVGVLANGNYDYGIFVSSRGFTNGAIQHLKISSVTVELITITDLLTMSKELNLEFSDSDQSSTNNDLIQKNKPSGDSNKEESQLNILFSKHNGGYKHPYLGRGVRVGSKVKIRYIEDKATYLYSIVDDQDSNEAMGLLSIKSPVGYALLGKSVGDIITVQTKAGDFDIEILEATNLFYRS